MHTTKVHEFSLGYMGDFAGHLVVIRKEIIFYDFGPIGGGSWFHLNQHFRDLRYGPQEKGYLLRRKTGTHGFCWGTDVQLIVKACNRHSNANASTWRLNFDKARYKRRHQIHQLGRVWC